MALAMELALLAGAPACAQEVVVDATGEVEESAAAVGPNGQYAVNFINETPMRVDVYYDDGNYGSLISTLEKVGNSDARMTINTYAGHRFWFTRHGVREMLVDPATDERIDFTMDPSRRDFLVPRGSATPKNPCRDRFPVCERQARNGGCEQSPGWMTVHCCESCDPFIESRTYIDPAKRCSRERLNMTDSKAWEPGSLNVLFSAWASSPDFAEFSPNVVSSPGGDAGGKDGPWVIVFDTFLTGEEADALVEGGRKEGFERSTDQGALNALGEREKVVSRTRTSANAWCFHKCLASPLVAGVTHKIEDITGIPEGNYENFQILEYEEGEFYRKHHDSMNKDKTVSGPRILTFFLYLSDVEEGGETRFSSLDINVAPKKGRAVVWPSVRDGDPERWDPRTFHEARPVIKGVKYAANHWIHLWDYRKPNHWGCTGSFT